MSARPGPLSILADLVLGGFESVGDGSLEVAEPDVLTGSLDGVPARRKGSPLALCLGDIGRPSDRLGVADRFGETCGPFSG